MATVFTAGHSNGELQEFVQLLAGNGIAELVDVRAYPGSRRNPQFNRDALSAALASAEIRYRWAGKHLGGMRKASIPSPHTALPPTMQGYAEHMQGEDFTDAARHLRSLAGGARVAIMCAERDPAHCHRSLIADYLLAGGDTVVHLLASGEHCDHRLNIAARQAPQGLIYDRQTQTSLDLG